MEKKYSRGSWGEKCIDQSKAFVEGYEAGNVYGMSKHRHRTRAVNPYTSLSDEHIQFEAGLDYFFEELDVKESMDYM